MTAVETQEDVRARYRREAEEQLRIERQRAEANRIADNAAREAAWSWLTTPVYTEIKAVNLVVPVASNVIAWAAVLRKNRQILAMRALYAVYFNISFTSTMEGIIPARQMATWVWGADSVPDHWRTQLAAMLPVMVKASDNPESGKHRLQLTFDNERNTITYKAWPAFFGSLHSMVDNGTVKFIRYYRTRARPTNEQFNHLIHFLGYAGDSSAPKCVRVHIERKRDELTKAPSLSTLSKNLSMLFIPSILGTRETCRDLGRVAQALAQNRSRKSTIKNRKIANFNGGGKLVCPALTKGVTYDVFAGNGTWKNKGYFATYWVKFHGLKEGRESRLFDLWAAAAEPLNMIIVGIDKENNQYDLAGMTAMAKTAPGKLFKLQIRVYSPEDWQTRWTALFKMPLPQMANEQAGATGAIKPKVEPPGDLPEIAELVRQAGGVRQTARSVTATKLDYSDLAKYLKTGSGLSPAKAAALRQHLCDSHPAGGSEIRDEFAAILEQHPGNVSYALAYRRLLLWSVVPIAPGTRSGYWRFGKYQRILPSEAEIIAWWTEHPEASIGLILGPLSGVFAFDIDNIAAEKALFKLVGKNPQCPIQRSGGWTEDASFRKHYLFKYPALIHAGAKWEPLVNGLEFRGRNGLLIMAPSRHKTWTPDDQKIYNWTEEGHEIWTMSLPPLPEAAIRLLIAHANAESPAQIAARKAKGTNNVAPSVTPGVLRYNGINFSVSTKEVINGRVNRGERNHRLFNAGLELRDRGMTQVEANKVLLPGARACGLEDNEILSTIGSVFTQPTRPRKAR
jgi:hypothetical protein